MKKTMILIAAISTTLAYAEQCFNTPTRDTWIGCCLIKRSLCMEDSTKTAEQCAVEMKGCLEQIGVKIEVKTNDEDKQDKERDRKLLRQYSGQCIQGNKNACRLAESLQNKMGNE